MWSQATFATIDASPHEVWEVLAVGFWPTTNDEHETTARGTRSAPRRVQ
jgi:hypothetical protein